MPRVKRGIMTHKRHAKLLELAKGYRTGRSSLFKRASEAVLQAGQFAYRDRRNKKRDLRRGWIVQVNAAVRLQGMTYSAFMAGLKKAGIEVNRKLLSQMAVNDETSIRALVEKVKNAA
jgi:large subunit ribosomal protein L20